MKYFNRDNISNKNERILYLLAELYFTLDLYYENLTKNEIAQRVIRYFPEILIIEAKP